MNTRETIDTFYDTEKEVDIEIKTTYKDGRPVIEITAYKGADCVCEFKADHMDRYFLDELELDD